MSDPYTYHTPRTMLITGVTGFIGSRLATLALSKGYAVRSLTRSDWATTPAVPIDQRFFGSLPEQIPANALHGVDVVVHCAAQVEGGEQSTFAVNLEGTMRLAELARGAGVQTFIFLSSQSARPDALSAYGKTKYEAEQGLLAGNGLRVIILRPGLVTGPGSRGLFRRMSQLVQTLPIIPILGGGQAIVQPIHVDDLCAAILRCDELADDLSDRILRLGDPEGLTLVEFLKKLAIAHGGRRKLTLSIPLWPVELVVGAAEALRIPVPINSNNLKAMKIVEKMDTRADLARLGLNLRPLPATIQDAAVPPEQSLSLKERAVRILLVGAGRIGLVHALTLSRLHGVVLSGIVDPKPAATGLLRGMGISAPMFRTIEEALTRAEPDAAVIATPVATHLPLTRVCLGRGLAVMVEKPLAIRREQLEAYEALAQEFPTQPLQVGYVMARNPQILSCLEGLHAGQFGRVTGFLGITLVSLIQGGGRDRWEVKKEMSGGGAYINAGGHVLSMIRTAFGEPQALEVQSLKLHSTEVEDSVTVSLTYPEFCGQHYCSWSINGYPRQENLLLIWTDRGRLILTGSMGVFVRNDGEVDITHQLDFSVGFNVAPDYAGAGFTTELTDLKEAVRTGRPAPMDLQEAARLERLLFRVYDSAREVTTFAGDASRREPLPSGRLRLSVTPSTDEQPRRPVRRLLDLRDISVAGVHAYLRGTKHSSLWDGYLFSPAQIKAASRQWYRGGDLRVTVPDFLTQSRHLSNGRYAEVLRQMGPRGVLAAVRAAAPLLLSERAPTFWVAAMGMLGADLQAVPPGFDGTVLLHTYLTDFALGLRRLDILEKMLAQCRRAHPLARIGFHTNMASETVNALRLLDTLVDEVSVLTSPRGRNLSALLSAMRQAGPHGPPTLTAEVGLAPPVVHRVAFEAPHRWAFGADAVLIGLGADPDLARERQAELEQDWARVFPGLPLPEGVA